MEHGHQEQKSENAQELFCPSCHSYFFLSEKEKKKHPQYCPFCGMMFSKKEKDLSFPSEGKESTSGEVSFIEGLIPPKDAVQFTLGPYQILQNIGRGGMGEVFLAYDTICGRRIALKRIRTDLMNHVQLHSRFLREARITSQLTHPAIIPIYAIHEEKNLIYYTMPFVEGSTLKQILRTTREKAHRGEKLDHIGGSIPALIRIFITICQAVAYAHSKGVLHRDLKPENIIVGKYGEVLILDWGLAKVSPLSKRKNDITEEEFTVTQETSSDELTYLGKVVGTIAYMAPERATGQPATIQTDIYALGVILYQLLTLHKPFRRGTLKEFRKTLPREVFVNPAEMAPYRDVPPPLAHISTVCLSPIPSERYQTTDHLIHDLENYIEGRSEWFRVAELDIHNKMDWEFQENVLIAEHIAITRHTDISDWVNIMISKTSFAENTKIEARIRIGEKGHGIGFLLSVPEATERKHLNDGYCLWLSSDRFKETKLLRSTVEVMNMPDLCLFRHDWYVIRIEKTENNIHFFLNNQLQFSYISHLPLSGTHVGILARDADFEINDFFVYAGSQNVMVNCLAIPDAFLAHKDYDKALTEYRRIGYSFPGRAEGREGMFRAGITLLEYARNAHPQTSQNYDLALAEFAKLHATPGAPLEYLGKALVYQALRDYEEEIKCFELAYRRYPHHPLLPVLQEQIVYRMHECSRSHRLATYGFVLLVLRHLSKVVASRNTQQLFTSLKKHWEPLYFFEEEPLCEQSEQIKNLCFAIPVAFWLAKPYFLIELIDSLIHLDDIPLYALVTAFFSLLELGAWPLVQNKIEKLKEDSSEKLQKLSPVFLLLEIAISCHTISLTSAVHSFLEKSFIQPENGEFVLAIYLMKQALTSKQTSLIYEIEKKLETTKYSQERRLLIHSLEIWAYLIDKNWEAAGTNLHLYPLEMLTQESSLLYFLYGCWLCATKGDEIAKLHFSPVFDVSYPHSWMLASHYLNGKIGKEEGWLNKAFMWEKRELYRQLVLYYDCGNEPKLVKHYQDLEEKESLIHLFS